MITMVMMTMVMMVVIMIGIVISGDDADGCGVNEAVVILMVW